MDEVVGETIVISCNDYVGIRRTDRNFKGDLPIEVLQKRLNTLKAVIEKNVGPSENLKTLMLTHKVLAAQQGYDNLLDALGDKLKDKEDTIFLFLMEKVELIFKALQNKDMLLLFDTLGVKQYPITKRSQKKQWRQYAVELTECREKTAFDVLNLTVESKLVPVPSVIENVLSDYKNYPDNAYCNVTVKQFLDIPYSQFLSAISFLYPESEFSTDHGVKGEQYDNVIFAITRGWANYQFDRYMPMILGDVPLDKLSSFTRNRNLFYVCCSRPRKRLYIFISHEIESEFENFLKYLVGEDNYYNYDAFIKKLTEE